MIQSDRHCGTCGNALLLKEFRGSEVFVCQGCKTVTVSKADFKKLLGNAPPATPAPAPPKPERARFSRGEPSIDLGDTSGAYGHDEPGLGFLRTEETEEFPSGPEMGTMVPTEVFGPEVDDEAYAAEPTERAGPYADDVPFQIQGEDDLDEATFEAELTAYQSRRQRSILVGGLVIVGVLLLVGLTVVGAGLAGLFVASPSDPPTDAAPSDAPAPDAQVPAEPAPAPAEPAPAAPAAPAPVAPAAPAPAKPAPAPAAPEPAEAPAPAGAGSLVRKGWGAFDRSPAEAEGFFRDALAIQPGHADANYGYGYALLKQGRATEATPYLCKAQQTGDAEIARDIRALLTHNGLSCE
ncbi:MAG: tetratricopeptide repeat protein [Myxococcota bacterium]